MNSRNKKQGKNKNVRVSTSVVKRSIFSTILKTLTFILSVIIIFTILFFSLIFRYIPTTSYSNGVWVKDIGFYGDKIPKHSLVLVDSKPNKDTIIDNLVNTVTVHPKSSIYETITGPFGKVSFLDGYVYVNDDILKGNTDSVENFTGFLKNQYLVKCVSGDCVENSFSIISKNNILGVKLG